MRYKLFFQKKHQKRLSNHDERSKRELSDAFSKHHNKVDMDKDKTPENSQNLVITIGRTFGSGGREIGAKIAERLGIAYFDKELLSRAAQGAGVSEDFVRDNDERFPKFISSVLSFSMGFSPMTWYQTSSSISSDSIYSTQSEVIRRIAAEGPCVIVGRSSDYVLRDYPRLVSLFFHAPDDVCIDRIMRRRDCIDRSKARQMMEKTNRLRAEYYNFYTDKRWGDASGYDLCIDTSLLSAADIADLVYEYVKRRFRL